MVASSVRWDHTWSPTALSFSIKMNFLHFSHYVLVFAFLSKLVGGRDVPALFIQWLWLLMSTTPYSSYPLKWRTPTQVRVIYCHFITSCSGSLQASYYSNERRNCWKRRYGNYFFFLCLYRFFTSCILCSPEYHFTSVFTTLIIKGSRHWVGEE